MKSKSLKKNYLLNLMYQVLTIIVPFITAPYISRVLRAEGVGAYSYTLAIATYIGTFAVMGMDIYGQLQTAKCKDDKKACSKLVYGIFLSKLMTTVAAIFIYIALKSQIGMYENLYWLMIVFFLSQLIDFTWFFQGVEEFGFILTRNALVKAIGVCCIFGFVKEVNDVEIYALILQGTVLAGNLLTLPYLRKFVSVIPIGQIEIFSNLKGGMIYFIPTVATSVYTMLDKAMIGWITKSSYENGYYEQSYKIVQMLLVVATSLRTVTLPRIVRLYHEKTYEKVMNIIDGTIRFVLCVSLPMSVGLMLVAPQLVPIMLGQGFERSISILQILSALIVVLGVSTLVSGQCLTAMGKQRQANLCVIIGASVNFIMNLGLIPNYGALGAAVSTLCAETLIMIMFFMFSTEYINIKKIVKYFLKYLLCSVIMAGIIYGLNYTGLENKILLLCQIAVGILVYFVELVLIKDDLMINFLCNIKHRFIKDY